MSEFECANGHLLKSGEYICPICGEKLARMDGMTRGECEQDDIEYIDDEYEMDEDCEDE